MKLACTILVSLAVCLAPRQARAINLDGAGCANGNGGAGATVACTSNDAAGHAKIVAVKWCDTANACTVSTSGDTIAVADTQGNVYTQIARLDSASSTDRRGMAIFKTSNIGANAANIVTLTVTSSNSVNLAGIMVSNVGGVTSTFTLDQVNYLDVTAAASPISISTSAPTTAANEIVYAWMNLDAGTLTIGSGYSSNRSVDTMEKDEWTSVSTTGTQTATMTFSGSQQQRAIIVTLKTVALGVGTYFISPTGSDSNNGTSVGTPWLTPSHPMTCGSVIQAAASTSYAEANFYQSNWGAVDCPASNDVVWLKCVTFDACKITSGGGNPGIYIDANYWGVQGWEVTITADTFAGCFLAAPNNGSHVPIHHVIFANNIANGCWAGGVGAGSSGPTASVDYIAIIGNIVYDAAKASANCPSNIDIFQPVNTFDSAPGTHIYVAGNFTFKAANTANCNGGFPATDGEGINVDTMNKSGGTSTYSGQVVVDNNMVLSNGGRGIEEELNSVGAPNAPAYYRNNTLWGNSADTSQTNNPCAEFQVTTAYSLEAFGNLVVPTLNTSCGTLPVYDFQVSTSPTTTDHIYNNWGYSSFGNDSNIVSSAGFSFGPNNTFGTPVTFANPTVPSAPSCGSASRVPNCMATVISNFTPTTAAAKSYGYQPVSTTPRYDPLYPTWLATVTNLPTGLVTPGTVTGDGIAGATISQGTVLH
jgi:hypothetical protein